ncbi:hypothetical protein O6Y00_00655 [Sphingomonas faeni]
MVAGHENLSQFGIEFWERSARIRMIGSYSALARCPEGPQYKNEAR